MFALRRRLPAWTRGYAATTPSSAATSGKVFDLEDADFEAKVLEAPGTVIVDCWADWCGPCRQLTPLLTRAVEKTPGVVLAKVNVDDNELIPSSLEYDLGRGRRREVRGASLTRRRVTAIPAVFAFYKGHVVSSFVGVPVEQELRNWVANVANPEWLLQASAQGAASKD